MDEVDPPDVAPHGVVGDASPLLERLREAHRRATRWLPGPGMVTPAAELAALAEDAAGEDDALADWDRYGEGGPVFALQAKVAELLGKPAAALFPSGIMAQQSILRVWADRSRSLRVALPPLSHLLQHELDGPRLLHGFRFEHLGKATETPTREALVALPGPLGAVLIELPLRDAGYLLPTWEELSDFAALCREREVPLHVDGARLWESTPYLGHSLAEVADLADSVYVSFYKGLGGFAGAVVAGPSDVVEQARQWRQRMGGTLFTMYPYAVAALRGLRRELPRMSQYRDYAVCLAERLAGSGLQVTPSPPHTNAFRLVAQVEADVVLERLVRYAEAEGTAVTPPWRPADVPGWSWTEFTVGAATVEWPVDEAAATLRRAVLAD